MRLAGNLHAELFLGLALRGTGAVSSFALLWMLARIYGSDVVGLYQLGLATVTLLALCADLGTPQLVVRKLANLIREGQLGDARTSFLTCIRRVFWRGLIAVAGLMLLATPLSHYVLEEPRVAPYLMVFAPIVLMLAILRTTNSLLRTTGSLIASQSLEGVFYTSVAAMIVAVAWSLGAAQSALLPVWAYLTGFTIALIISCLLTHRTIAPWPKGKALIGPYAGVFIAAVPITAGAGDWLHILIVTSFGGLEETGIFRTAFQFCALFQLVSSSFAVMIGPHLARASGAGDDSQVRRIVRLAGLTGLGLCLPIAAVGLFAPGFLLGLFGPEFRTGATTLQILVIAQMINVAFGPFGGALFMFHHEKFILKAEIAATAVGVIAAFVLIRPMGIAGIAIGTLSAAVVRNAAIFVRTRAVMKARQADGSLAA